MTDNEIKKVLECCINDNCDNCPDTFGNCEHNAMRNALDLINRLEAEVKEKEERLQAQADVIFLYEKVIKDKTAEIEKLTVNKNAYGLGMQRLAKQLETAKSEAIKEFWNRLKSQSTMDKRIVSVESGDNLVKEMTENDFKAGDEK